MSAVQMIPVVLASLSLAFASFAKNKDWATIAFIVWLVLFMLTFIIK